MRYKKCDFCGAMVAEEDACVNGEKRSAYDSFADLTIDIGIDFDTFEICGDCANTIIKICKKTRGEEK